MCQNGQVRVKPTCDDSSSLASEHGRAYSAKTFGHRDQASLFAGTGDDLDATALAARVRAPRGIPRRGGGVGARADRRTGRRAQRAHRRPRRRGAPAGAGHRGDALPGRAGRAAGRRAVLRQGRDLGAGGARHERQRGAARLRRPRRRGRRGADARRRGESSWARPTTRKLLCLRGITDNQVYGVTRNPWSAGHSPGGSTAEGPGRRSPPRHDAARARLRRGRPIRIPASFCGVTGIKPSYGRVPDGPGFDGWLTLTVNGALARSVRDLRLCCLRRARGAGSSRPFVRRGGACARAHGTAAHRVQRGPRLRTGGARRTSRLRPRGRRAARRGAASRGCRSAHR